MARIRVTHGIGRLAADMANIPARARVDMRATVHRIERLQVVGQYPG